MQTDVNKIFDIRHISDLFDEQAGFCVLFLRTLLRSGNWLLKILRLLAFSIIIQLCCLHLFLRTASTNHYIWLPSGLLLSQNNSKWRLWQILRYFLFSVRISAGYKRRDIDQYKTLHNIATCVQLVGLVCCSDDVALAYDPQKYRNTTWTCTWL